MAEGIYRSNRPITVVDARMGRGKTSAAIQYMNESRGHKRFLYVTPYLDEVSKVCEMCGFDQPQNDYSTKSNELKRKMHLGKNIAITHALFYLMDKDALDIAKNMGYSLIVDESLHVIRKLCITSKDFDLITNNLTTEDAHLLHWKDPEYQGVFDGYKEMADANSLFRLDSALLNIMNPSLLCSFDEVFLLTYMFEGQYQKAYLDFFGLPYEVVGVIAEDDRYRFSDQPDRPPPIDYRSLIHIVDKQKMNDIGRERYALSKNWYAERKYNNPQIKTLRNNLRNFYRSIPDSNVNTRLWTTFKDDKDKLVESGNGRYKSGFLQISARATNDYRNRKDLAYLANRFTDPNLMKFFAGRGASVDQEQFALSEMLQWIWRSAIRDNKPINLYIPSKRMRDLLTSWIDLTYQGGSVIA